jgi:hypothetical protein
MREPSFDEFADLWQEHDPQEGFEGLARKARRQAKLQAYVDAAFALLILGGIGAGAFLKPNIPSAIFALSSLALTAWVSLKRRQIRQMTRTIDTSGREAFVASSLRVSKANLRRVTITLAAFPPTMLIAILFRVSLKNAGHFTHPLGAIAAWASSPRGIIVLILLAALAAWMERSRRRAQGEVRRLEALQADYAEEERREASDAL